MFFASLLKQQAGDKKPACSLISEKN